MANAAAPACCSGAAAPTVRKSWTFRTPSERSAGAITHPIRQPVTEYVLLMLLMMIVRSRMPGRVAIGMCCAPSYRMCS